jgi:SAM-dependent methyltransferase
MTKMRKLARRSKTAIICHKIYLNWLMRRNYSRGAIDASMGSTHSNKTIAESLAYIELQYEDYCTYAELAPENIKGKRILELGCGDNVGVALRFLADEAAQVVCLDKFYALRDSQNERDIYLELRQRLSSDQRRAFDDAVNLTSGIEINQQRLRCIHGRELDEFARDNNNDEDRFDIILSRAVIEEIYDPEPIFETADRLLRPGGLVSHKIDLSDYGMNPLTFLTIPEWIYRRMASASGIPNRKLIGYYRELVARFEYSARFFISNLVGRGDLIPHKERLELNIDYGESEISLIENFRPRLNSTFANLPTEDLLVSGIFLVARKPNESDN